jgi:preprotein translocase subunit SecF
MYGRMTSAIRQTFARSITTTAMTAQPGAFVSGVAQHLCRLISFVATISIDVGSGTDPDERPELYDSLVNLIM